MVFHQHDQMVAVMWRGQSSQLSVILLMFVPRVLGHVFQVGRYECLFAGLVLKMEGGQICVSSCYDVSLLAYLLAVVYRLEIQEMGNAAIESALPINKTQECKQTILPNQLYSQTRLILFYQNMEDFHFQNFLSRKETFLLQEILSVQLLLRILNIVSFPPPISPGK